MGVLAADVTAQPCHRSSNRLWKNLTSMFSSGVVRGLWFELTAVTFIAMFVWLSNKVPHHPLFSPFFHLHRPFCCFCADRSACRGPTVTRGESWRRVAHAVLRPFCHGAGHPSRVADALDHPGRPIPSRPPGAALPAQQVPLAALLTDQLVRGERRDVSS